MKPNYLLKNKFRNSYLKRILITIVIFALGLTIFTLFGGLIISLVSPIWKARNIIVTGENLSPVLDRRTENGAIVASVLAYPPQTPYDIIIIDAGSNDSVEAGSKVFLPEGPMLGRVSEVFPNQAKVKLFSASGEETGAVLERNNVPITLIGRGGGNFKFSLPRDMAVEIGDRIVSRDIGAHLLAIVEDINVKPTDSFKKILAKSPTNIFTLRFVFVAP